MKKRSKLHFIDTDNASENKYKCESEEKTC